MYLTDTHPPTPPFQHLLITKYNALLCFLAAQYADPNDDDDNSNTYLSVHQTEGSADALNSTEVVITGGFS